ncbi:two-component sensor histidine kinase [Paenibacillus sambharensis]|uniref:histidine kinase n=1 Tax=Paenibacillus sambharensis TaxID=1803190 RepID=A0A2W1LMT1_9BACL|nr:HAMP domain-containing sensor histidine kinase [Paenibacillus sambharensis]PZD96195.1 two-component sensor histidine kinase [Paenibacillus sambharensis]
MIYIKNIMLQLLFALMPFVLFTIYYRDKAVNYSRCFITLTSCLCLLLSMTFPSTVETGFIFDIRYVIMFFGIMFGGMPTGIVLLAVFILYRLYLGGDGMLSAYTILLVTFPLSILLVNRYHMAKERKQLIVALAGLSFSVIPLLILFMMETNYMLSHLSFHIMVMPVQNSLGIWLLISLFKKAATDKELFISYVHNERVQAISHVAASLAHEVRNPLTSVMGFLKLIRNPSLPREKVDQYIDVCTEELVRMQTILSEYLAVSRPLGKHREEIDLSEQIHAVADVMTPYANMNNVKLVVDDGSMSVRVESNRDEMKQLLINFIKNAIEACSNRSDGMVVIRLLASNHEAGLLIKDNGIGMSPEQIERLGTVYFSTKSTGTGLGLTFSYQLIRSLGGRVTVRSEPENGTEFIIRLPVSSARS